MSEENKVIIVGMDVPFIEMISLALRWFIATLIGVGIPVLLFASIVTMIIESQ